MIQKIFMFIKTLFKDKVIRYEHHGVLVYVRAALKGKHRAYCLCFHDCALFAPGTPSNCSKAEELFAFDKRNNMVTPVFECDRYTKRDKDTKFEFVCPRCYSAISEMQYGHAAPETKCPKCGTVTIAEYARHIVGK